MVTQSKSESSSTSNMYKGGFAIIAAVVFSIWLLSVYIRTGRVFSTGRGGDEGYRLVAKSEKSVKMVV